MLLSAICSLLRQYLVSQLKMQSAWKQCMVLFPYASWLVSTWVCVVMSLVGLLLVFWVVYDGFSNVGRGCVCVV